MKVSKEYVKWYNTMKRIKIYFHMLQKILRTIEYIIAANTYVDIEWQCLITKEMQDDQDNEKMLIRCISHPLCMQTLWRRDVLTHLYLSFSLFITGSDFFASINELVGKRHNISLTNPQYQGQVKN